MAINLQSLIKSTLTSAQSADPSRVLSSSISDSARNVNQALTTFQAADPGKIANNLGQQAVGSALTSLQSNDPTKVITSSITDAAQGVNNTLESFQSLDAGSIKNVDSQQSIGKLLTDLQSSDQESSTGYGENALRDANTRAQTIDWGHNRFASNVLAAAGGNELSRPNRYECVFVAGSGITKVGSSVTPEERLRLLCNTAQLPNRAVMTSDHRHFNRSVKFAYASTYEPITFTFNSSDDFYERKWLESWMESIVDTKTGSIKYYDEYIGKIIVYTVDRNGKPNGGVQIFEAYPINIATVDMSYSSMDEITQIAVTFNYLYWERFY